MDIQRHKLTAVSAGLALLLMVASQNLLQAKPGLAKLRATVRPVESDIFIDGQHMGDATWDGTLTVPDIGPGEHTVEVRNWGFTPQTFKMNFEAGRTTLLQARLEPIQGSVAELFGQIEVKGHRRADILLNGTTPEYQVGHGGLSNGRFSSKLLVPPGTYQLAMVHGDKTLWAGPVTVQEGHRTVVDTDKGTTQVASAGPMPDPPRFHGGLLRSQVVVGKTTANLSAVPGTINCGDSSQLTWNSTDAVHTDISGVGDVSTSGQQQVSPTATTTYTMTAKGPGGIETPTSTVTVNKDVDATLTVSPAEVTYPGTATVSWSVNGPGSKTVSIDPLGTVDASGSRQVDITNGDQNITYTLHATNQCGGDVTRTASLHMIAAAQPAPAAPQQAEPAAEPAQELPHTASPIPLLTLIGLVSLGAALVLRQLVKRMV